MSTPSVIERRTSFVWWAFLLGWVESVTLYVIGWPGFSFWIIPLGPMLASALALAVDAVRVAMWVRADRQREREKVVKSRLAMRGAFFGAERVDWTIPKD